MFHPANSELQYISTIPGRQWVWLLATNYRGRVKGNVSSQQKPSGILYRVL